MFRVWAFPRSCHGTAAHENAIGELLHRIQLTWNHVTHSLCPLFRPRSELVLDPPIRRGWGQGALELIAFMCPSPFGFFCLSLCLSVSLSLCLSVSLSLCLSVSLSLCLSVSLSLCLSVSLSLCLSVSLSPFFSFSVSVSLSLPLFRFLCHSFALALSRSISLVQDTLPE